MENTQAKQAVPRRGLRPELAAIAASMGHRCSILTSGASIFAKWGTGPKEFLGFDQKQAERNLMKLLHAREAAREAAQLKKDDRMAEEAAKEQA